MSANTFFTLFRRRGFSETMEILNNFPDNAIIQSKFFQHLVSIKSYPNTYFRVKDNMLKHKLIAYRLNDKNEKVIYLTEKGKKIWKLITEIDTMLS
jgi:hypothetical protein